jgi:outer membrane biosynthesis protein TonB
LLARLNVLILLTVALATSQVCYAQSQKTNATDKDKQPTCFCVPPSTLDNSQKNGGNSSAVKPEPFDCEKVGGTTKVYKASEVEQKAVITYRAEPLYTVEASQNHMTGVIELRVVLCPQGFVSYIHVTKGLPGGLTDQAIIAVKKLKFRPAKKGGIPVAQHLTVEYHFLG